MARADVHNQKVKAIDLVAAGRSPKEAAVEVGVSESAVRRWAEAAGVFTPAKPRRERKKGLPAGCHLPGGMPDLGDLAQACKCDPDPELEALAGKAAKGELPARPWSRPKPEAIAQDAEPAAPEPQPLPSQVEIVIPAGQPAEVVTQGDVIVRPVPPAQPAAPAPDPEKPRYRRVATKQPVFIADLDEGELTLEFERVAYHEAGHVVIMRALGFSDAVGGVYVSHGQIAGKAVRNGHGAPFRPYTAPESCLVGIAGAVAEVIAAGRIPLIGNVIPRASSADLEMCEAFDDAQLERAIEHVERLLRTTHRKAWLAEARRMLEHVEKLTAAMAEEDEFREAAE